MQHNKTLQMIHVNGNIANSGIDYLMVLSIIRACIAIKTIGSEICHALLPVNTKELNKIPVFSPIIASSTFSAVFIRSSRLIELGAYIL